MYLKEKEGGAKGKKKCHDVSPFRQRRRPHLAQPIVKTWGYTIIMARERVSLSLFRYIKINPKKGNGHTHARCDRSSSIDWDRGCFGGYFYISLERCGS